jgi:uncharacterized protein (TIGR02266 family)
VTGGGTVFCEKPPKNPYKRSARQLQMGRRMNTSTEHGPIPEFIERREGERLSIALEVALTGDSQFFTGITGDIARGGLFVSTYRTLEIGTTVDLAFSLPDGATIKTTGTVRWTRPHSAGAEPGLGISFDALSAEDRAHIETFCAQRAPLYHDD